MADITYTVNQDNPDNIQGFEQFSQADKNLIGTFTVNSLFDSTKNFAEVHIYSLSDTLLESQYDYSKYKLLGNAQSAGKSGASVLTIDPIEDSKTYGYQYGGIKLLYHFLNDLYTTQKQKVPFYIESISPDRTEVRLQSLELTTDEIKSFTAAIKDKLANQSYFNEFRLNFENNDLLIAINIDVLDSGDNSYVVVKLYEPLPSAYGLKSTTYVNEVVSDSVIFEVDSAIEVPQEQPNALRPANFNLDVADYSVIPTGYYSYNDLFSYPVNNANSQVFSLVSEKGAELSIDHTDYNDFIHFSSAYERLLNFKYKLQLLENYSSSLSQITNQTSQSIGVTGSTTYYNNLTQGILSNFDHYERYLYYESSSNAWPKANSTTPYVNYSTTSSISLNWYSNQLANANGYDLSNQNLLTNTIPTYISDDDANQNYLTFVHMIGQHFDNLWIYAKAVSDKYDGDNRLDFGISKDLVGEALRNFGVKLYTSNKSIQDLFASFTGQPYQTGSEVINNYITGSLRNRPTVPTQPIPYDNYNKEVQKRIYHNLSHLLKTKGTERGVRALINCFGIPSDILQIKTYGGRNTDQNLFFGDYQYYTSSLDKIRLDNTGSIVDGDTLSGNVSIVKRDPKYTDDLHSVEIGFSPTDNIDKLIVSHSTATASLSSFNIDQYIGDPRNLTSNTYDQLDSTGSMVTDLTALTNTIMSSSAAYNVFDYVRLIKFFDNTVFKTVRDFLPARVVADTGIIIKPHLLSRSKAKSVTTTGTDVENLSTGSIDTAFIESTHGRTFGSRDQYSAKYIETVQTPTGLSTTPYHNQQEAKYDGELSGSQITVTNGELTEDNTYLLATYIESIDNLQYISASATTCQLAAVVAGPQLVHATDENNGEYQISQFFVGAQDSNMTYTLTPIDPPGAPFTITWPYIFSESLFDQYDTFTITAVDGNIVSPPCTAFADFIYGVCDIIAVSETDLANSGLSVIRLNDINYPTEPNLLTTYFSIGDQHDLNQLQVTFIINEGTPQEVTPPPITGAQAQSFNWNSLGYSFDASDTVKIIVTDPQLAAAISCTDYVVVTVADCTIVELQGMVELSYSTVAPTPFGHGYTGRYMNNLSYLEGNIILGGTNGFGEANQPPPPESSPINNTAYQYPNEGITRNMPALFPYLTNPNYIFEQLNPTTKLPTGVPRETLPIITSTPGEFSDLSGRQLGLASFFTNLGDLENISYEVYIYEVLDPFDQDYDSLGSPGVGDEPGEASNILKFAATDFNDNYWPMIGQVVGDNTPTYRTGAIHSGIKSTDQPIDLYPDNGYYSEAEGGLVPWWTYTDEAPNSGYNGIQGYVAKLNIKAMVEAFQYGKRNVYPPGSPTNFTPGYGHFIKIYAYSPLSETESPNQGYTCVSNSYIDMPLGILVENFYKVDGDGPGDPGDFFGFP